MTAGEDEPAQIEALRSEGRYREAAQLLHAQGRIEDATHLLAEVWEYAAAVEIAEQGGRLDLAYAHALAGGDAAAASRILACISDEPEQARQAVQTAREKGRVVDAARLLMSLGEFEEAGPLFEEGAELLQAASCYEAVGAYRQAGKLYEQRVREAPDDGEAALHLGSILTHFGRFRPAVEALQKAAEDPAHTGPALRMMVASFVRLGMQEAARQCLARLRAANPELPDQVEAYLEHAFGDPAGFSVDGGDAKKELLAGRYRMEKQLGSGATGKVLLAHDDFYDRAVAIKVLTVGDAAVGRDAYARFAREARVAAALDHPNIVRVFEYNAQGPFLVMELMKGGTLEDRLEGRVGQALDLDLVEHVMAGVLSGLEAVHRRGVVHRDLKPANIFFGPSGVVKLGDFGTAHLNDLGTTMTGAMLGTLAYMAPEQITASRAPVAATDYYACGVLLFRMITGRLPYPGPDFIRQHLESPPPLVSEAVPELGEVFDALVVSLLAKRVEDRPQSIGAIRSHLASVNWDVLMPERAQRSSEPTPTKPEPAPTPPGEAGRYRTEESADGPNRLAFDHAMQRRVWLRRGAAEQLTTWAAFAGADGPYLQAVYALRDDEIVLEAPRGRRLSELTQEGAGEWERVKRDVGLALKRVHAAGLTHGSVDTDHILLGAHRAVLLLPQRGGQGTADEDMAALASLFPG